MAKGRGMGLSSRKGFLGRHFGPKTAAVAAGGVGYAVGRSGGRSGGGSSNDERNEDISFIDRITPNSIFGWILVGLLVWFICNKYKLIPKIKK